MKQQLSIIFCWLVLTIQSHAEESMFSPPLSPSTPAHCQAVFYPESGILTLPCLTVFPESEPNYHIRLGLILLDQSFGFVLQDYAMSQADLTRPENAQCVAQFLPETGELNIPCVTVANTADFMYSAGLQLNTSLFSSYFSLTRLEPHSEDSSAQSVTPDTPTTTQPEPIPELPSNIPLQINFAGDGQGVITVDGQSCEQSCSLSVPKGESLSLLALALNEYEVEGWQGDCVSNSSNTQKCAISDSVSASRSSLSVTITFKRVTREAHALLLLHGMNSDESTWNTYLTKDERFDITSCSAVFGGVLEDPYILSAQTTPPALGCFRVRFGAYDAISGRVGLENFSASSPQKGDFSSFDTLGDEVAEAVIALQNAYRRYYGEQIELKIALLGHSRGGLAARAFLQSDTVDDAVKSAIAALLTTGTPHNGSPLGRIYTYLKDSCLSNNTVRLGDDGWFSNDPCFDDWQVVDSLRYGQCNGISLSEDRLDVRKPTVDDLSDHSTGISGLRANADKLPASIRYGSLRYTGIDLGQLARNYRIFDLAGINACDQVSSNAQYALLQGSSPSADHLTGDGIVPYINQAFPAGFASYDKMPKYAELYHTKEPKEELHINDGLKALLPDW
ncbi:esterase/lipase family protein [Candidatus Venteria ishoeyi]|uniref:PGAP1-like protein n=1 Tax=Candidatus Venteria ishoeyi TaxID=1899563 RepID=A0A1H6FHJ1_9GAMM|nr:hypothetical protein [Candidatus Venteria ishoeyi]SEH08829.1 PGAP1-like protein [Candidatus Venteria ishoeyi]